MALGVETFLFNCLQKLEKHLNFVIWTSWIQKAEIICLILACTCRYSDFVTLRHNNLSSGDTGAARVQFCYSIYLFINLSFGLTDSD